MKRNVAEGSTTAPELSEGVAEPIDDERQTLRLARGAGISFAGKILGRLVQIGAQILFARTLGMEDFGRFALGMTIVRMLGTISPLGVNKAAVVFGARYWRTDDARFRGIAFGTAGIAATSSLAIAVALIVAADWVSGVVLQSAISPNQLRAFASMIPLVATMRVLVDLSRVSQRMQFGAIAEDIAQPAVALVLFAGLYLGGGRLTAAVTATGLAYAVACTLAGVFVFRLFRDALGRVGPVRLQLRHVLVWSAPTAAAVVCAVCSTMIDRLVVGRYRPPDEMALYQAAGQVSIAFTIILGSFTTIFSPMAARFIARDDRAALQRLLWSSTKWGLYLSLPLFVFLIIAPGDVLAVTFGPDYASAAPALILLAGGQFVNAATGNVGVLLVTSGHQTALMLLALASAVINAGIGVALTQSYGINGAAFANLLANIVLFGGSTLLVARRLGLWPYERRSWRILVPAAASCAAGMAVLAVAVSLPLLVAVGLTGSAVLATFAAGVWMNGLDADEQVLLRDVSRRLRRSGGG